MPLTETDLYSATRLRESRRRVHNLGFFEEVNVSTSPGSEEGLMNVDVAVKERPTGTFSVGVGYSSVDGALAQGSVTQENFLGRALKLNLAGSFGKRSTTYQVGITDPYFLDYNLTVGFDIYDTERQWTDFTRKATGGNLKVGFPVATDVRAFFLYRYEQKEITDVSPNASLLIREQEGRSTISSIYSALTRNTTDYRLDPTRGSVAEGSIEFAGLGGTEKFSKYILDYRHFFPMPWGTVFSAHGQIGYIQEIGGRPIPIDERFFLGGINTMRGFRVRQVGPRIRQDFVDAQGNVVFTDFEYIGGNKQAHFNLEYLFPLIRDAGVKGVLFFDAGNAWSEGENYFQDLRYSAGAGVRWFSPLGPLRLEWGYNLDPREGEKRSQFEFSIGRFF
jgi:outer membrane protein insertion porin family